MNIELLVQAVDAEIAVLQKVRAILAGPPVKKINVRRTKAASFAPTVVRKRSRLSPEARARIAEGQKRRWAAVRKTAG